MGTGVGVVACRFLPLLNLAALRLAPGHLSSESAGPRKLGSSVRPRALTPAALLGGTNVVLYFFPFIIVAACVRN